MMDVQEMRGKSEQELRDELLRLRRAQFELRVQSRAGQLSRNHLFRETRRDIARVQTLLRENQEKMK